MFEKLKFFGIFRIFCFEPKMFRFLIKFEISGFWILVSDSMEQLCEFFLSSRLSCAISEAGQSGFFPSNKYWCFRAFENYVFFFFISDVENLQVASLSESVFPQRLLVKLRPLCVDFKTLYVLCLMSSIFYPLVPFVAEILQKLTKFLKVSFLIFFLRNFLGALFSDHFHLVLISKLSRRTFFQSQAFLIATSCSRKP